MMRLDPSSIILGENSFIAPTVIFLAPERNQDTCSIVIGNGVKIRDGAIIYGGVFIDDDVTIDHYCIIRESSRIGAKTRISNFTEIHRDVTIGNNCIIGGYLANRTFVGDNTSSFGHILHTYSEHGPGRIENTPKIGNNVIIGRLAIVAGGVEVPSGTRIKAGSVISRKSLPWACE